MSPRIGAGRVSRDSSRATGQGHERCGAGRRRGGCARAWALGASSPPPAPPLPPPSRTNWTRLVPPSVLTGHVSSLLPYSPPPASGAARRASSMWSFPSRARSLSSSSGANSAQRSITNLHIKIKSNQISYCSPPHHHPAGSASGRCSSRRTGHACSTPGTGHACSTPGALKVVTKVQQSGHKGSTKWSQRFNARPNQRPPRPARTRPVAGGARTAHAARAKGRRRLSARRWTRRATRPPRRGAARALATRLPCRRAFSTDAACPISTG
jgi:hypothetical protein